MSPFKRISMPMHRYGEPEFDREYVHWGLHNPDIQRLALDLIGSGPKHMRNHLMEKYPTAGLVVINFTAGLWSSVDINSGVLNQFLVPRELRAS